MSIASARRRRREGRGGRIAGCPCRFPTLIHSPQPPNLQVTRRVLPIPAPQPASLDAMPLSALRFDPPSSAAVTAGTVQVRSALAWLLTRQPQGNFASFMPLLLPTGLVFANGRIAISSSPFGIDPVLLGVSPCCACLARPRLWGLDEANGERTADGRRRPLGRRNDVVGPAALPPVIRPSRPTSCGFSSSCLTSCGG